MNDKELRKQVKILKAIGQIDRYAEMADYIDISVHSFYNWLNGYYNLSGAKKNILYDIICDLTLVE